MRIVIKGKDYSQENRGAKVKALLVRGHIKIIFKSMVRAYLQVGMFGMTSV